MKEKLAMCMAVLFAVTAISGCVGKREEAGSVILSENITKLTDGLSAVRHSGDYGFDEFLAQGGASSDAEVVSFLMENGMTGFGNLLFGGNPFGCSTLAVKDENGNSLFGRNFDWNPCHGMIIQNTPENGYASISTANMDFISVSGIRLSSLPDEIQALAGLYAPLDGVNEMGLAVSVNMIQDSDTIEQDTDKPDITTTTAVRLLLDRAATVDEALALLRQYDMHASANSCYHFQIADAAGRAVVVEYIGDEMNVVESPRATNFLLTEGDWDFGRGQDRFAVLEETMEASGGVRVSF